MNERWPQSSGTRCSTPAFWPLHSPSGGRWCSPGRAARWCRAWAIVLYLILADLQNTVLCAWLVFAERLIYPSYAAVPRSGGISALNDQAAAGAIMWVPGSIAFLLPIAWIVGQMLSPQGPQAAILSHQHVAAGRLRLHGSGNGEE